MRWASTCQIAVQRLVFCDIFQATAYHLSCHLSIVAVGYMTLCLRRISRSDADVKCMLYFSRCATVGTRDRLRHRGGAAATRWRASAFASRAASTRATAALSSKCPTRSACGCGLNHASRVVPNLSILLEATPLLVDVSH